MRLVRMILRGFKSFAHSTEIEFVDGVTGIVGPNGAGKSNIADAVRWVLGEQNVRQLRGEKAADVIFAGTQEVRAKAAAEVTLVFDNPNEVLMPDVAEVAVTRRLLRSGDSDYMINRRPCRLKDIHLLFADTGLGKDSMAVIGQNRVDRILIGKPEERKVIFEEVAGITRFRMRKQDGLRKLRAAEQNMQRVQDVVQVYTEQLGPLAARAETAREYHEWRERRQAATTTLAWQCWQNARRKLTRTEHELIKTEQVLTAAQTAVVQAQAERERQLAQDEVEAQQQRRLEQARTDAQMHEERAKGNRRAIEEQIDRHEVRRQEAEQALADVRQALATGEQAMRRALEEQESRRAHGRRIEEESATAIRAAESAEEAMRSYRVRCAQHEERRRQDRAAAATRQAEAAAMSREIALLTEQVQTRKTRLAQVQEEEAAWQVSVTEATTAAHAMQTELAAAEAAVQAAAARYEACARLRAQRQEAQAVRRQEIARCQERIAYLERLAKEYEGYGRATKTVLKANGSWRADCLGTVADIMTVPAAYTTALDIALGARLQHVVVRDSATAKAAIRYLQQCGGGRTTFYPLTEIRARRFSEAEKAALGEDGVIGSAAQCVTCDATYAALVSYLLGATLIVDTMDTAQRLVRKYERRLRMVTLDGQLFQPGGSVTGGSTRQAEVTVFGRRQEWQTLQTELADRQRAPEIVVPSLDEVTAARAAADAQLQQLTATAVRSESRREAAVAAHARCAEMIRMEREACEAAAARIAQLRAQADAITVPEEDAADTQEAPPYRDEELTALRRQATDAQIRLAQAQSDAARAEEHRQTLLGRQEELVAQEQRQCAQLDALTAEAEELAARGTACREALVAAMAAAAEATAAADAFYEAHGERREAQLQANAAYDALREAERDAKSAEQVARAKVEAAQTEVEKRAAEFAATGCTPETIEAIRVEGTTPELERLVTEADRAIAALGDVNPHAQEEYRKACEQHQFYETQLADLAQARDGLQQVITTIDREMDRQFTAAFTAVGTEFQRIFTHLFGGGEARLELVAGEDDPVGGVEIFIRPPGKKRQSLTLLSGGERALTVIALLFAFQVVRPAPFCLVDEVDAALDDANVERFGRYLQDGRKDTQFIVITHRKQTMQAADRLIGVTMAQQGISTLISVDLKETEDRDELFG